MTRIVNEIASFTDPSGTQITIQEVIKHEWQKSVVIKLSGVPLELDRRLSVSITFARPELIRKWVNLINSEGILANVRNFLDGRLDSYTQILLVGNGRYHGSVGVKDNQFYIGEIARYRSRDYVLEDPIRMFAELRDAVNYYLDNDTTAFS